MLGLRKADAEELADELKFAVQNLEAELGKLDRYGQRYVLDFEMTRNLRAAKIRSVWIVDPDKDYPRLVTCFVL